ncbi:MAG: hypothetical protein M3220_14535 [Chloroflexota bacterium]|nr:hypothetical protein [Chloroflexota bacterium]
MNPNVDLTKAMDILHTRFGERIEEGHDEGLRMMAEALQEALGLASERAEETVKALEAARSIRWVQEPTPDDTLSKPVDATDEQDVVLERRFQAPSGKVLAGIPVEGGCWDLT